MGLPVILTPQAIEDLGGIVRRIATDSPDRARSFGHALLDAALTIDPFPIAVAWSPKLATRPCVRSCTATNGSSTRSSETPMRSMSFVSGTAPEAPRTCPHPDPVGHRREIVKPQPSRLSRLLSAIGPATADVFVANL